MEFIQKRIRGKSQKTYREWHDDTGNYRITWRSEWMGIQVTPAFYSCVRTVRPNGEGWDFVGRMGTYKTFNKAVQEAERNRKLWERFLKLANGERKGRIARIRALDSTARTTGRRIFASVPVWVHETDAYALRFLTTTLTNTEESSSPTGATSSKDPTPGPASNAADLGPSQNASSECVESTHESPARTVKARGKARKKSAKQPTKKRSTSGVTEC